MTDKENGKYHLYYKSRTQLKEDIHSDNCWCKIDQFGNKITEQDWYNGNYFWKVVHEK